MFQAVDGEATNMTISDEKRRELILLTRPVYLLCNDEGCVAADDDVLVVFTSEQKAIDFRARHTFSTPIIETSGVCAWAMCERKGSSWVLDPE